MTAAQLGAVLAGYFVPLPKLFDLTVIYGSPLFFIMNLLGSNSVAFDQNPLFPLIALFHVVKYLLLCRSQFIEERYSLHYLAVIFEVLYLVICARYI